jgi:hypothetical protein
VGTATVPDTLTGWCTDADADADRRHLNFVEPHHDARIIVTTAAGTRTEELGRRSSYTYQLEA